jgi:hypothetical protein
MTGTYFETRGDTTQLSSVHPDLGRKFIHLCEKLDVPFRFHDPKGPLGEMTADKYKTLQSFNAALKTIRGKFGFEDLLLDPSQIEVQKAASLGPIVSSNVSSTLTSDCFIVTKNDIFHLPLLELNFQEMQINAQKLVEALENDDIFNQRSTNNVISWVMK